MTFKDLQVNNLFQFPASKARGLEYRPLYQKVSARKYRRIRPGDPVEVEYTVGTITVKVEGMK